MSGDGGGGDEAVKMEEEESRGGGGECEVLMWGYLPGATSQRSPLLSPTIVNLPDSISPGDSWKDVCGGGCGFAMATSESGKLITWGSTDDMGQSYVTARKHGVVWCLIWVQRDSIVVRFKQRLSISTTRPTRNCLSSRFLAPRINDELRKEIYVELLRICSERLLNLLQWTNMMK